MRSRTKSSIISILLAGGLALASSGRAWALTSCLIDFSNYSALHAMPQSAGTTFAVAPYFQQPCSSGTFTVADRGGGHYHLMFENSCVNCFGSNGYFGLNRACAGTGTGCQNIDPAAYPRYVASHDGDQVFVVTGAPNPGMWCAGSGCIPTDGKLFKPSVIFSRIGPPLEVIVMSLTTTTIDTESGPQVIPIRVTVFFDNLTQRSFWSLGGNKLLADSLMVVGSQGSAGGTFQWDNLTIFQ